MIWSGSHDDIIKAACAYFNGTNLHAVISRARELIPQYKREIDLFQAYALGAIASHINGKILEIGTAHGFSAAVMALASPYSCITTLNPKDGEFEIAQMNLASLNCVTVVKARSEDYLEVAQAHQYDLIFDDGDHQHVAANLPYVDLLVEGGVMLWHDYSPADSARPCPPVYDVLGKVFTRRKTVKPDIIINDTQRVGMAGILRQANESYTDWDIPLDYAPWKVKYPEKVWVNDGQH